MEILFISLGVCSEKDKLDISGGEVRWIELAKEWGKQGHVISVLTIPKGRELFEKLGLKANYYVVPGIFGNSKMSYIKRSLTAFNLPKTLRNFKGVVYSTTEHIYDVLPARRLCNKKNIFWVAVAHWVAPLNRKGTTFLNSLLFYLNQRSGLLMIKDRANLILGVSDPTTDDLIKFGCDKSKIHSVTCGVNLEEIAQTLKDTAPSKEYEAVFMKRLTGTKGIFDAIEMWRDVVEKHTDARLLVMGAGDESTLKKLDEMIKEYNLGTNVILHGPEFNFKTKFNLLSKSKIFILPSYEENWAIVVGEAMAAGLPVICYDLPEIRPIWGDHVFWIPKENKSSFANSINMLLNNSSYRDVIGKRNQEFIKKYDWRNIAKTEMKFISNKIKGDKYEIK